MRLTATDTLHLSAAEHARISVLRVLLYFDVFSYALTLNEIFNYSAHTSLTDTAEAIEKLLQQKIITETNGMYFRLTAWAISATAKN